MRQRSVRVGTGTESLLTIKLDKEIKLLGLIKRYGGIFDFLCAAVPVKFFGSLLAGGVWVMSDPVASLAPDPRGLNGKAWDRSESLLGSPYSRLPACMEGHGR